MAWQLKKRTAETTQINDPQEPAIAKTVAPHRVRYLVMDGDTLNSIAANQLGDVRFTDLLVTINRVQIEFVDCENGKSVHIRPGQMLWLPGMNELVIYKKHFFQAKARSTSSKTSTSFWPISLSGQPSGAEASPSKDTIVSSAPVPLSGTKSGGKNIFSVAPILTGNEKRVKLEDRAADSMQQPLSSSLSAIRFSGNRIHVSLGDIEKSIQRISERRCYHVVDNEGLTEICAHDPVIHDHRLWALVARMNGLSTATDMCGRPTARLIPGQFLVLPNEHEVAQFRLLNKMEIYGNKPFSQPALQSRAVQGTVECDLLNEISRLRIIKPSTGDGGWTVALQMLLSNGWNTVAQYDCDQTGAWRAQFHYSQKVHTMRVELPKEVAVQLAKEDLRRNCNLYCNQFVAIRSSDSCLHPSAVQVRI